MKLYQYHATYWTADHRIGRVSGCVHAEKYLEALSKAHDALTVFIHKHLIHLEVRELAEGEDTLKL